MPKSTPNTYKKRTSKKTFNRIGRVLLVLLMTLAVIMITVNAYYYYVVKPFRTVVGINNISDQIGVDIIDKMQKEDELSEQEKQEFEERWFLNVNYYSNDANNGIELQEMRLDYFTGFELTSNQYRSSGMQYVGNFKTYDNYGSSSEAEQYVVSDFIYYDTTNGISWNGYAGKYGSVATKLNRNEKFIIKIDNEPYLIQLTGSITKGWWIFSVRGYFDYGDVFASVINAVKSNSAGYGDYYITLDLSTFFSISKYDTTSGTFVKDDVSDVIKNYCVLKFHYDRNGARNATQSMFNCIESDANYDLDKTIDTTYWQERIVYNIDLNTKIKNVDVLNKRYSEAYGGYLISLNPLAKAYFEEMERTRINLKLNLGLLRANNIIGFDYGAFKDFELNSIELLSVDERNFYLLEESLVDTKLKSFKYNSKITLVKSDNFSDNAFVEVIS